ncbi:MAG: hypothetical protein AB8F34_02785 [Akkermansiaceae bacterium]
MKFPKKLTNTIPTAMVVTGAIFCCSCQERQDMSYEKETLKLTAELAASQTKNEALKKQLGDRENKISTLQKQITSLEENTAKIETAHKAQKFDREKIQLGFMKHVEVLKAKVEAENQGFLVESVTLERMVLPSERPFSSGVVMRVKSAKSGQVKSFRWQGFGDPKGEWEFEQDSSFNSGTGLADNNKPSPTTPQANPKPRPVTPPSRPQPIRDSSNGDKVIRVPGWDQNGNQANNGGNNSGSNTQPQPTQPQPKPTRKPVRPIGGGNVHQIDWNSIGQ